MGGNAVKKAVITFCGLCFFQSWKKNKFHIISLPCLGLPLFAGARVLDTHLECQKAACMVAWTRNPKLWVSWSLMVANDVPIPRECFTKISEFFKRNWLKAAHI